MLQTPQHTDTVLFISRILLSALFIVQGIEKLLAYQGNVSFMTASGFMFPAAVSAIAIVVELGGGLALLLGYRSSIAVVCIALLTLLFSLVIHTELSNRIHSDQFLKNLAVIGGLLLLFNYGAGRWSLDYYSKRISNRVSFEGEK